MARQLRLEYPGAVYHPPSPRGYGGTGVMARGDGGNRVFLWSEDHESLLDWLEQVCAAVLVGAALGMATGPEDLVRLRKGERNKVMVATLVKRPSAVSNGWLAAWLGMGHPAYLSNLVQAMRKNPEDAEILAKHESIFRTKDRPQMN